LLDEAGRPGETIVAFALLPGLPVAAR